MRSELAAGGAGTRKGFLRERGWDGVRGGFGGLGAAPALPEPPPRPLWGSFWGVGGCVEGEDPKVEAAEVQESSRAGAGLRLGAPSPRGGQASSPPLLPAASWPPQIAQKLRPGPQNQDKPTLALSCGGRRCPRAICVHPVPGSLLWKRAAWRGCCLRTLVNRLAIRNIWVFALISFPFPWHRLGPERPPQGAEQLQCGRVQRVLPEPPQAPQGSPSNPAFLPPAPCFQ